MSTMSFDASKRSLARATARDIANYKKFINMDPVVAKMDYFSKENSANWVNLERWDEYRANIRRGLSQSGSQLKPRPTQNTHSEQVQHDIIEISSDSEPELPKRDTRHNLTPAKKRALSVTSIQQTPKKPRLTKTVKEVIELSDSEPDDELPIIKVENTSRNDSRLATILSPSLQRKEPVIKTEHQPNNGTRSTAVDESAKDQCGKYVLSRKVKVDKIECLSEIPKRWPVPPQDITVAYVIDLKDDKRWNSSTSKKNIDYFLKQEDQDSWGLGSNGTTAKPTPIRFLQDLPTRRSVHECNGARCCELFDMKLLEGYLRDDPYDMSLIQKIFAEHQKQNERDGGTVIGMTEIFYRLIEGMSCKKASCNGKAVLLPLKKAPSVHGKKYFVGCSKWRTSEEFQHLYAPIPSHVDETILFQFINGNQIMSEDLDQYKSPCSLFRHPRHGKQKRCTHTHFRDQMPYSANMIDYKCNVKKITYTSLDINRPIVVVIFQGHHTHPPWPEEKPTQEAKADFRKCLDAFGIYGATADKLDTAPSTVAILGMPLSEKHGSYRNKRVLQDAVRSGKENEAPAGLQWNGVVEQYNKDLKNLKADEQYIWAIRMEGNIKLVVTAHPVLASLIHDARYLVCDYTFKRTNGELNEWEVAIWWSASNERITVSRAYSNSSTHEAFDYVWEGFFTAVERATGKKIKFKVFDPSGNILCVILDMEAAQVQGLGTTIIRLKLNDPSLSQIKESDPDKIVQYLLKLCYVHWERNLEKLVPHVGREAVEYLNKFPALEDPNDIVAWRAFCENHPCKELHDWYTHKISYPWLLPGFNRTLSRMPNTSWTLTPNHSNLVETAHVGTNKNTGINLTPVEAIEKARQFDNRVATSVLAASKTCIPRNINNGEKARMSRNLGRQSHRAEQSRIHNKLDNEISNTRSHLDDSAQRVKELKAHLKELNDQKKDAGKSPRHSRAPSNRFDIPIPKIQGLTVPTSSNTSNAPLDNSFVHSAGGDSNPEPVLNSNSTIPAAASSDLVVEENIGIGSLIESSPVMPQPLESVTATAKSSTIDDEAFEHHPGFELPPFDLDLFNAMLENEPMPEPSAAEIAAHRFLRQTLGK